MKKIINILTIAIIITFAGCRQAEILNEKTTENTKKQSIFTENFSIQNGILHFKNSKDYFETLNFLNMMTIQEYEKWCSENSFKSMYSLYNEFNEKLSNTENELEVENLAKEYANTIEKKLMEIMKVLK